MAAAAFPIVGLNESERYMRERFGISAAVLKWIAVVSMVIDHFACSVYPCLNGYDIEVYHILRGIGRIAFPIYCYLLVEGFFLTKNVWRYLRNLLLFAAVSEIPFNMAVLGHVFYPQGQNVYCALAIGICAMMLLKRVDGFRVWQLLAQGVVIAVFLFLGEVLEVDYHWKGIAFIVLFYYLRKLRLWAPWRLASMSGRRSLRSCRYIYTTESADGRQSMCFMQFIHCICFCLGCCGFGLADCAFSVWCMKSYEKA